MIDLNMKPKKQDEEPLGMIILGLMPFVIAFVVLIEAGL